MSFNQKNNTRLNALADQVKSQRTDLIVKVKSLREKRQALKGVKGTGRQWADLTTEIDQVQAKIDLLSKSLGLSVKVTNSSMSGRPHQLNNKPGNGYKPSSPRLYTQGKTANEVGKQFAGREGRTFNGNMTKMIGKPIENRDGTYHSSKAYQSQRDAVLKENK